MTKTRMDLDKTVDDVTTKYYYYGTRFIQQCDEDNTLQFTYDRDG